MWAPFFSPVFAVKRFYIFNEVKTHLVNWGDEESRNIWKSERDLRSP